MAASKLLKLADKFKLVQEDHLVGDRGYINFVTYKKEDSDEIIVIPSNREGFDWILVEMFGGKTYAVHDNDAFKIDAEWGDDWYNILSDVGFTVIDDRKNREDEPLSLDADFQTAIQKLADKFKLAQENSDDILPKYEDIDSGGVNKAFSIGYKHAVEYDIKMGFWADPEASYRSWINYHEHNNTLESWMETNKNDYFTGYLTGFRKYENTEEYRERHKDFLESHNVKPPDARYYDELNKLYEKFNINLPNNHEDESFSLNADFKMAIRKLSKRHSKINYKCKG